MSGGVTEESCDSSSFVFSKEEALRAQKFGAVVLR